MFKKTIFLFLFSVFAFLPGDCEAARSLNIVADKLSLSGEEEMSITASASGFTNGETVYVKGAFYKEESTNYFGFTKNGDAWIENGASAATQRQIKIGEWDGKIAVKSDFSDSGFQGEGEYKFKVGFYYLTGTGSLSSVNWSGNILDISLNEPDYTPTSSPTPTKTPTPTNSPIPTKTPTPSPKPSITAKPSPSDSKSDLNLASQAQNDIFNNKGQTPTPEAQVLGESTAKFPFLLITLGLIFLAVCGILAYLQFGEKIFLGLRKKQE